MAMRTIALTDKSRIALLIEDALAVLTEDGAICLSGSGPATMKVVNLAEVLKRNSQTYIK